MVSAGCDKVRELIDSDANEGTTTSKSNSRSTSTPPTHTAARTGDTISVASFNIQVFGQSKLKKTDAMEVLAQIVRRFDVVAIQEIRSKKDNVIPDFVKLINSDGSQYHYVVGERLGRTVSKEQYAFIYDTTCLEVVPGSTYTVPDPGDKLHREPLATSFAARGTEQPFTFTLVNIHTDPDETKQELDALDDAFRYVQQKNPSEDDVIILGDLNVDERHLGELGQLPNITWVVSGVKTNTRLTKSYDNIVFDRAATNEYTGTWGVLNLMDTFDLSQKEALRVSDHMPVWAVFSSTEGALSEWLASLIEKPVLRIASSFEPCGREGEAPAEPRASGRFSARPEPRPPEDAGLDSE